MPDMMNDNEIDTLLQKRAAPPAAPATPAPAGSPPSPSGSASAALEPARSFSDHLADIWGNPYIKGGARELAKLGVGGAKLLSEGGALGAVTPDNAREAIGESIEQHVPGARQTREFSEAQPPSEDEFKESIGGFLADLGLGAAIPEIGLEGLAAKAARYFYPMFQRGVQQVPTYVNPLGAGGRWMMGNAPTVTYRPGARAIEKAARVAGRSADRAAQGGVAGAVADPDDPATGAVTGAATGAVLGPAAGKVLRSPTVQEYGGHLLRGGAGAAVGHGLGSVLGHSTLGAELGGFAGIGTHAAKRAVSRYGSQPGQAMERASRYIFDKSGHIVGMQPVTTGVWAGEGARRYNEGNLPSIPGGESTAEPATIFDELRHAPIPRPAED